MPAFGVYACLVDEVEPPTASAVAARRLARAAANIGVRPTFSEQTPSVEVHLLDFAGDLYGRWLRVHLIERLRGEQRFASADDLVRQIGQDLAQARTRLGTAAPSAGAAWY